MKKKFSKGLLLLLVVLVLCLVMPASALAHGWDEDCLHTYTVTYCANGGEGDVPEPEVWTTFYEGWTFDLDYSVQPTRTGYLFWGWGVAPWGVWPTDQVSANVWCPNVVVYALWTPCTCHCWDEGVITEDPTCTEVGEILYTCHCCGLTRTEEVPALDHDWDEDYTVDVAPTCTEEGFQSIHCGRCEAVKDEEVIPALDHDWDEGVITTEPTCTEAGVKTYTCLNDATHTKTEEVAALGHEWGEWKVEKAATATQTGLKVRVCARCGEVEKEVLPITGPTAPTKNVPTGLVQSTGLAVGELQLILSAVALFIGATLAMIVVRKEEK